MAERQPIAFLSYVRSDDDHDDGRITRFRKQLEGEVRMQTGVPFAIFQDRNDIAWGQHWEERINTSLSDVTFLIPIITPSFFHSPACRTEFQAFSLKERTLGLNRLILPLYYVACDQLDGEHNKGLDDIVDVIRERNWTDWRQFRFKPLNEENTGSEMAKMAAMIKSSIKELTEIKKAEEPNRETTSPVSRSSEEKLPKIVSEEEILSFQKRDTIAVDSAPLEDSTYGITDDQHVEENNLSSKGTEPSQYHVFTRRFDEIIDPKSIADESELTRLYSYVAEFADALRKIHGTNLANKLSGFRKIGDGSPLAVTILIDNSGSMRGSKIIHTAAWCLIIMEWMDRLGIPVEILGYTTRAWKGGQSREAWLASGKPAAPGRLNDLRHVIYKAFSASTEVSALNFGVMAREGLLKENIDGEALLWAYSRLEIHPADNKFLFVISDGAPVDDSTLSVNPSNFLEKHLISVIAELSDKISLYAIGLEHDVSRYYPSSSSLLDTSYLGVRFFDTLIFNKHFSDFWTSKPAPLKITRPKRRTRKKAEGPVTAK